MRTQPKHQIIVIGGGYAGAMAAVRVAGRARRRAEVTLVDLRPSSCLRLHQAEARRFEATRSPS